MQWINVKPDKGYDKMKTSDKIQWHCYHPYFMQSIGKRIATNKVYFNGDILHSVDSLSLLEVGLTDGFENLKGELLVRLSDTSILVGVF